MNLLKGDQMRPLLLLILISIAAAADPPAAAPPQPPGMQTPVKERTTTKGKRSKSPRPLRRLRRLGRVEPDLALRLSSWGIERDAPTR